MGIGALTANSWKIVERPNRTAADLMLKFPFFLTSVMAVKFLCGII